MKFFDTITRDESCAGGCATTILSGEGREGVTDSRAADRLRLFVVTGGWTSGFNDDSVAFLGLPLRPEDFCGCSESETMGAGVLGGSALIFWLERPRVRRSVGVSDVLDAIDCDLEPAKADGVALAACLPLGAKLSCAEEGFSSDFCSFLKGDFFLDLLGRVGDSVSVRGLTSLSGRTGDDGRKFCC